MILIQFINLIFMFLGIVMVAEFLSERFFRPLYRRFLTRKMTIDQVSEDRLMETSIETQALARKNKFGVICMLVDKKSGGMFVSLDEVDVEQAKALANHLIEVHIKPHEIRERCKTHPRFN